MKKAILPERRKNPRRGLAVRVVIRDHRPLMHATTRNLSLGGMYLMTATRKLLPGRDATAEIEIDGHDERWSPPLPVELVWHDQTNAGVKFRDLPAQVHRFLYELLENTVQRRAHRRYPQRNA